MRKLTSILIFLLTALSFYGQKTNDSTLTILRTEAVNCNLTATGCNLIPNNAFVTNGTINSSNPFAANVQSWASTHGSPQLNIGVASPATGINFASMWANSRYGTNDGEGIAVGIPALTAGNTYSFSFQKCFFPEASMPTTSLSRFVIMLVQCANLPSQNASTIPAAPRNSQVIYCETGMNNRNWQQVNVCFVPNSTYNAIWIFPLETTRNQSWVNFALPELYDITSFTAGQKPSAVYPNCNVTIGPTVPNCGPSNAIFTWTGPNGQSIQVGANNQQITIDAGVNYGVWTLTMITNGVVTNNGCSNNQCNVVSTVGVPKCECQKPTISPTGPITYYNDYETPNKVTLTSSVSSSYQWYKNGTLIAGATTQTYDISFEGINSFTDYYTVSDGCGNSQPVQFNYIGCDDASDYPVSIPWSTLCQSALTPPNSYQLPPAISGSGVTTTWWLYYNPSCYTINSTGQISQNSNYGNWCFDAVYTKSSLNGQDVYMFYGLNANPACRIANTNTQVSIFPNPINPNSEAVIQSSENILQIELRSFAGLQVKRVRVDHSKKVQISTVGLKEGVYVCTIVTDKQTCTLKLVVKK